MHATIFADIYAAPDCMPLEALYDVTGAANATPVAVSCAELPRLSRASASYTDLYAEMGCVPTETLYASLDEPIHTARPLGHVSVHGIVALPGVAPLAATLLAATDKTETAVPARCIDATVAAAEQQPLGQYSVHGLLVRPSKRVRVSWHEGGCDRGG